MHRPINSRGRTGRVSFTQSEGVLRTQNEAKTASPWTAASLAPGGTTEHVQICTLHEGEVIVPQGSHGQHDSDYRRFGGFVDRLRPLFYGYPIAKSGKCTQNQNRRTTISKQTSTPDEIPKSHNHDADNADTSEQDGTSRRDFLTASAAGLVAGPIRTQTLTGTAFAADADAGGRRAKRAQDGCSLAPPPPRPPSASAPPPPPWGRILIDSHP